MASTMTTRVGPILGASTNRIGIATGDHNTILQSASVTDVLKGTNGVTGAGKGFLHNMVVASVGVGWQLDFYDDPATTTNLIWTWVTADGKGPFALQVPLNSGLVVVSNGGTPGRVSIVWS